MCSYHFCCSKLAKMMFRSKYSWLTLHQVNQTWIKVISGVYERLCANYRHLNSNLCECCLKHICYSAQWKLLKTTFTIQCPSSSRVRVQGLGSILIHWSWKRNECPTQVLYPWFLHTVAEVLTSLAIIFLPARLSIWTIHWQWLCRLGNKNIHRNKTRSWLAEVLVPNLHALVNKLSSKWCDGSTSDYGHVP
jgi:hypothetical protein